VTWQTPSWLLLFIFEVKLCDYSYRTVHWFDFVVSSTDQICLKHTVICRVIVASALSVFLPLSDSALFAAWKGRGSYANWNDSVQLLSHNYNTGMRQNAKRGGSTGRIWIVIFCGSLGPIRGSVITVGLPLGLGFRSGSRLGLRIVVYKLLEKVTKCESIMWLKLTNGVPPHRSARSAFFLSCPYNKWVNVAFTIVGSKRRNRKNLCLLNSPQPFVIGSWKELKKVYLPFSNNIVIALSIYLILSVK